MDYPRISIITPNYNMGNFLEETIKSVVSQEYPNLEYIIVDGGSSDNSIDIIKKYESQLTFWVSEPDRGLYDALSKGFARSTGEIMGWLNSDDILHTRSLFTIAEIFSEFNNVNWLQGYPTVIDEMGRVVYHRAPRHSKFAFYLHDYRDGIFIQQESTFWTRKLWKNAGGYVSTDYKYAGDFELWMRFYRKEKLYTTTVFLGAFRKRKTGQLSFLNYENYLLECDDIISHGLINLERNEKKILKRIRLIRRLKKYVKNIENWPYIRKYLRAYLNTPACIAFSYADQKFVNE